jgi:hypothetical protein
MLRRYDPKRNYLKQERTLTRDTFARKLTEYAIIFTGTATKITARRSLASSTIFRVISFSIIARGTYRLTVVRSLQHVRASYHRAVQMLGGRRSWQRLRNHSVRRSTLHWLCLPGAAQRFKRHAYATLLLLLRYRSDVARYAGYARRPHAGEHLPVPPTLLATAHRDERGFGSVIHTGGAPYTQQLKVATRCARAHSLQHS